MRAISRCVKAIILIMFFYSIALAQLPDLFDPLFDHDKHILKPKQAKEHHVLSCNVYQDGRLINTIVYDGNGHVISDHDGKAYYSYKDGMILSIIEFDPQYFSTSDTYVDYKDDNILTKIRKYYEDSNSEEAYHYNYYTDGPLAEIMHYYFNEEKNEVTQIQTEFRYESKKINAAKRSKGIYKASSRKLMYSFVELFKWKDGRLDTLETRENTEENKIIDKIFRFKYDNENKLSKICRIEGSGKEADVEWFTYNDKGLIKTRKTEHNEYRYDYTFMGTARLNIEIRDTIENIEVSQYWKHYDQRTIGKTPGKWSFDIYIPGLEFFMINISEDIEYPVMLEPGHTVNVIYADGKFLEVNNDPSNNMIWEIEDFKRRRALVLTTDGLRKQMKSKIDELFRENYQLPVFLYYSHVYDLRYIERDKDAFDELADLIAGPMESYFDFIRTYAKDMITRYPLNSLAMQKYSHNKE